MGCDPNLLVGEDGENLEGDVKIPHSKRVLQLQERRVAIQKAYDAVLKKLIVKREVAIGYQPLVKKVTAAFQEVNTGLRHFLKHLRSETGSAESRQQDLQDLAISIERILKLEKEKLDLVAGFHMEQIRLYQTTVQKTLSGDQNESMRRQQYDEVARLRRKIDEFEQEIEEELCEVRYGYDY